MFEDKDAIKTNVNKESLGDGQPEGTLKQNLHDTNPGDQNLSASKLNALNTEPKTDQGSYAQIPSEEVRPELDK